MLLFCPISGATGSFSIFGGDWHGWRMVAGGGAGNGVLARKAPTPPGRGNWGVGQYWFWPARVAGDACARDARLVALGNAGRGRSRAAGAIHCSVCARIAALARGGPSGYGAPIAAYLLGHLAR